MNLSYEFAKVAISFIGDHRAVLESFCYAFLRMEDFPMSIYNLLDWWVVSIVGGRERGARVLPFGSVFQEGVTFYALGFLLLFHSVFLGVTPVSEFLLQMVHGAGCVFW